jgi:hypothetical protein
VGRDDGQGAGPATSALSIPGLSTPHDEHLTSLPVDERRVPQIEVVEVEQVEGEVDHALRAWAAEYALYDAQELFMVAIRWPKKLLDASGRLSL